MCRRYFGVDSYGIVEVKSNKEFGLEYVYHGADGVILKMCGNGCRTFVAFVKMFGIHPGSDDVTFLAKDGLHYGNYDTLTRESWASIVDIPETTTTKVSDTEFFVDTGLPHFVKFVDFDVVTMGDLIRKGEELSSKWNKFATDESHLYVNFVNDRSSSGSLYARCYSRNLGREDICCGTGTAAIGKHQSTSLSYANTR